MRYSFQPLRADGVRGGWHEHKSGHGRILSVSATTTSDAANTHADGVTVSKTIKETSENQFNITLSVKTKQDLSQIVSNANDIETSFGDISKATSLLSKSWIVTNPMGQYIRLNADTLKCNKAVTVSTDGNTLTWNLNGLSGKSDNGYHTYTLTYPITLDTSAEGFQEKNGSANKYYPTNGYTKLDYLYYDKNGNFLDKDGKVLATAPAAPNAISFNVPGVKGTVPSYGYTIVYQKHNKETKKYDIFMGPFAGGKAKLYSTVNIGSVYPAIETAYVDLGGENYSYIEAASSPTVAQISSDPNKNIITLSYYPDAAAVEIQRWYKTIDFVKGNHHITGDRNANEDRFFRPVRIGFIRGGSVLMGKCCCFFGSLS